MIQAGGPADRGELLAELFVLHFFFGEDGGPVGRRESAGEGLFVKKRVRRGVRGVGSGAGPFVVNGGLGHAGADGVKFDVGEGDSEVGFAMTQAS